MNKIDGYCYDDGSTEVVVDGVDLDLAESLRVWNHSPSGFSWGYGGSGPAQTALGVLLRFTDDDTAVRLHQAFKWAHVAAWGSWGREAENRTFHAELDVPAWIAGELDRLPFGDELSRRIATTEDL